MVIKSTDIPRPLAAPAYPGRASAPLIAELQRYVVMDPQPFVLDLDRCQGMYLATVDGQRIFDWGGHYASRLIGHNHPRMAEPEYLRRLARAANNKVPNPDFLTEDCLAYYRLLHQLAPRCMRGPNLEVYAVNSGAEAVENMMKYLINLHDEKMLASRRMVGSRRFIYFDNAFHGRTIFALNVTQLAHDPMITEDFRGLVPANLQVPFPAVDASRSDADNRATVQRSLDLVEDALTRYAGEVVAILVEPIQGAGGHRVAPKEFFQGLSRLAHEHDVFLGFDEVQTAGGQTGSVFAADQLDLPYPPQAIATGKKFAVGVVYMLQTMEDRGVLDSTWGGNLADMVRFVQEWSIVEDEHLLEQVPAKAQVLVDGLNGLAERYPRVLYNVRGWGLYQGFSLRPPHTSSRLHAIALQEQNLFLLPAGPGTIRLRPALDVTIAEIQLLIDLLEPCLQSLEKCE